jgi:hypothetical protein
MLGLRLMKIHHTAAIPALTRPGSYVSAPAGGHSQLAQTAPEIRNVPVAAGCPRCGLSPLRPNSFARQRNQTERIKQLCLLVGRQPRRVFRTEALENFVLEVNDEMA